MSICRQHSDIALFDISAPKGMLDQMPPCCHVHGCHCLSQSEIMTCHGARSSQELGAGVLCSLRHGLFSLVFDGSPYW